MTTALDFWVFGYGSLVFNPGMEVAETRRATLHGYRRRFCMWSIHHRGSEADPGLVLALESHAGATCTGLAIRPADPEPALASLRERELISSAYHETTVPLVTDDGEPMDSLAYVIDVTHRQYARDLSLEQQARIIAEAHGGRGPNHEYLTQSVDGLAKLGVRDPELDWLVARVQQMRAAS
ncbi:MAG: gamma-glutamylcyclotransferase [Pseudomonadota bacterium]